VLGNHDLERIVETNDEWITSRSGIKERRIAAEDECTSELAAEATKRALEMAGVAAGEVDLIVLGTASGDMPLPSTACHLQRRIGAKKAAAFDVSAGCSGFLYALAVADKFVKTGAAKTAVVVGVEILSKFLDWKDRTTCILFGDGAGTVVLRAEERKDRGILSTHIHSDGDGWNLIMIPGGGTVHPPSQRTLDEGLHYIRMQGKETFKVAVKSLADVAVEALEANGMTKDDVAHLVSHQANSRIIQAVVDRLGIAQEKVHVNLDRYGNTSAASIPITLDEGVRSGRVKDGDTILMTAFGAGLTWGSALARW
jgi:3-oxoacyl-[acyl-carrier-protein] synthase-3